MTDDLTPAERARIAHGRECDVLVHKLQEWLSQTNVPDVYDRRRGGQRGDFPTPALRVVPTADNTGRVHMSIDQFCALMGVDRSAMKDPDRKLADLIEN